MKRLLERTGLDVLAAAAALGASAVVTASVLVATGSDPLHAFSAMGSYAAQPDSLVTIINRSMTYYLSALAVALSFRMNMFNMGVDGQYRLAALLAAALGGSVALPPGVGQILIILCAMLVGALWAGLAALLKVTRGISEVISTIMLNFVATGVVAYLLTPGRLAVSVQGSNNIGTRPIPGSGQIPGFTFPGASFTVFGFVIVAILAGVGYTVLLNRSRFGFELRATGMAPAAAAASGINAKRMIITTMLLSGAVAGLVGMPQLLGASYSYSLDFPTGLGFTGVAIALLGRNNAVGMALAALLWAFLDQSSLILDLDGIPKEIVVITQGVVIIFVVITYEVMRRRAVVRQQRQVRQDTAPELAKAQVAA